MMKPIRIILILLFAGFSIAVPYSNAQDKTEAVSKKHEQSIAISPEMDDVMIREATKVKEEFKQKARSLFDRIAYRLGFQYHQVFIQSGTFTARENTGLYALRDRAKQGAGRDRIHSGIDIYYRCLI